MDEETRVEELCARLAGIKDVFLPRKHCEPEVEDSAEITIKEKCDELHEYFKQRPVKFLQRYHEHIKPKEISCFNSLSENEEIGFYIRKICHRQDLEYRTEIDDHYVPHEVKNRRYRAMQRMIKDGDYFSESQMEKRSPDLYEYYIGRFLSTEEKEEKRKAQVASHPTSLSGFLLDVIAKKIEQEGLEVDEDVEEFDEDSEEEEEVPTITEKDKAYFAEEFQSRMYQHFLDGHDKNFAYESVDDNTEYDDFDQIEQDVADKYFDEEKPSDVNGSNTLEVEKEESEDELDQYMKSLEEMDHGENTHTEEKGS